MPSLLHEGIIALIREKPGLAAKLLRDVLHVAVPSFTEARLTEASINEVVPTEYHADAVVLLVAGAPVFGIIVEAQLRIDRAKLLSWPMYATSGRARHGCGFVVLVVTADRATARWAAEPLDLGGGNFWKPFVIGPDGIPIITDVERAAREPEVAVLSVMAHGRGRDVEVAVAIAAAAAAGASNLPEALKMLYFALIESSLGSAARKSFEMLPQHQKFLSENMRRSFSEGEAKGKAEGEAKGRAEGEAKGKAEGEAKGEARAILRVLTRRGLAVTEAQGQRILECTDILTLEAWLDRAVTASSTDELFV